MLKALGACLVTAVAAITVIGAPTALASGAAPAQCAPRAPIELPFNSWAPARKQLAPPGAAAIRLCRYNAFGVRTTRPLDATALVTSPGAVGALVGASRPS